MEIYIAPIHANMLLGAEQLIENILKSIQLKHPIENTYNNTHGNIETDGFILEFNCLSLKEKCNQAQIMQAVFRVILDQEPSRQSTIQKVDQTLCTNRNTKLQVVKKHVLILSHFDEFYTDFYQEILQIQGDFEAKKNHEKIQACYYQ